MTRVRARGEQVRTFIVETLAVHPRDIVRVAAQHFGISRQAVNRHLANLIDEKAVIAEGITSGRRYRLAPLVEWNEAYPIAPHITEDVVWQKVAPQLGKLPENVKHIWQYAFTEMLNNALDHSEGQFVSVNLVKTAVSTQMYIYDNGVGIFRKIQAALNLVDPRHAVLELAKGKFTTDPARHSGQGIFFASRSCDNFTILSGDVHFSHDFGAEDWIVERPPSVATTGTVVFMQLHNHTARTLKGIFDAWASAEAGDLGFTKTVVPVKLAQYGDDNLVSRSQAKRLLVRVDRFRTVLLDFEGVETIGQAFADEIFRVFHVAHPEVELLPINAGGEVMTMIARARGAAGIQT